MRMTLAPRGPTAWTQPSLLIPTEQAPCGPAAWPLRCWAGVLRARHPQRVHRHSKRTARPRPSASVPASLPGRRALCPGAVTAEEPTRQGRRTPGTAPPPLTMAKCGCVCWRPPGPVGPSRGPVARHSWRLQTLWFVRNGPEQDQSRQPVEHMGTDPLGTHVRAAQTCPADVLVGVPQACVHGPRPARWWI